MYQNISFHNSTAYLASAKWFLNACKKTNSDEANTTNITSVGSYICKC